MIKTTVLKKATQTRDVLISVSIFKMKTPYSNFIKYEINLSKFIREGPQFANIRIYVDDTTEYLAERYKNFSYVEFVKYEYSPLKLSKGHYGTFGTLVRFMPLFYWPSGYKYVWVSDIDINVYLGLSYSYIEEMKNANFLYASLVYYPKPWIENEYNIINYRVISDRSFAPTVFTSFLKDIEGPLQDKIKQIIEYDKSGKVKFLIKRIDSSDNKIFFSSVFNSIICFCNSSEFKEILLENLEPYSGKHFTQCQFDYPVLNSTEWKETQPNIYIKTNWQWSPG
jgi:hypothetical protein